jgi:hypothetical protein
MLLLAAGMAAIGLVWSSAASGQTEDLMPFKQVVSRQITLIMDGDREKLATTLTERLRPEITSMTIMQARAKLQGSNIEELVDLVKLTDTGERKTAVITRRDGKPLTTLIWDHDQWLVDDLWFL